MVFLLDNMVEELVNTFKVKLSNLVNIRVIKFANIHSGSAIMINVTNSVVFLTIYQIKTAELQYHF